MTNAVSLEFARAAKDVVAKAFRSLTGEDVSIGLTRVGDDGYALKVNLTTDPGADIELPSEIEGVPIQIEVVGKLRKLT